MFLADVPGQLRSTDLRRTAETIAEWQLESGMIPWVPDGHADPWNHAEAIMALNLAGFRTEAELGFDWLLAKQRADGSWHQYYLAHGVEADKLDANVCAYPVTAAWHHFLLHGDTGFLESVWSMVDAAIDFVLELQTARGEVLWARHADGTPWSFALLTGSSSISHSLRCALAIAAELGHERPAWDDGLARLVATIRTAPDAFAPKHRWAMDWYYPVLTGAIDGDDAAARLADRGATFLLHGLGVKCVSDRPWVTAAESCESAMAFLRSGDRDTAELLFGWAQTLRTESGRYWTGMVYPQEDTFPADEQSTYTAAAVVLTADALTGASPASGLFTDPTSVRGLATNPSPIVR